MHRRKKNLNQNLDSLTDVICNVVGILIILLAVMQVCAGEVLDSKTTDPSSPNPSSDDLERAKQEYDQLQTTLSELQDRWSKVEPQTKDARAELERLTTTVQQRAHDTASGKTPGYDIDKLRYRLEVHEKRKAELDQLLAKAQDERDRLNAIIGQLLANKKSNIKTARLPDPRSAPEGARPAIFFCRYGQIVYLDAEDLFKTLIAAIRITIQGTKTVQVADLFKVKKYFSTNDIGNQIFRWKMLVYKKNNGLHYLRSELMWRRDDIGETLEEIQHATSKFQKKLDSLKKNNKFISFIVWSDSFDTYLEARRIADGSGFAAGWFAYDSNEEFRYSLADRDDGGGTQKAID